MNFREFLNSKIGKKVEIFFGYSSDGDMEDSIGVIREVFDDFIKFDDEDYETPFYIQMNQIIYITKPDDD